MMKRLNSTLWMIVTGLVTICLLIPSLPLEAASKIKKKISSVKRSSVKKYTKKYSKKYASHKRKRRSGVGCNVTVGRMQALAYLQSSKELAALASLEYRPDPNLQDFINNDSEELSDSDGFVDDEDMDEATIENENDIATFKADTRSFQKLWLSYMKDIDGTEEDDDARQQQMIAGSIEKKDLMSHILSWIGTTYYYGGTSRSGIDCSAFTGSIYRGAGEIVLPRTAAQQSTVGEHVKSTELRLGDLVFFNTRRAVYVSHVGVYLGDNLFAHASSRYGVTVSSLQTEYYKTRFLGAKRLRSDDLQLLAIPGKAVSLLHNVFRIPSLAKHSKTTLVGAE